MMPKVGIELIGGRYDGFQTEGHPRFVEFPLMVTTRAHANTHDPEMYVANGQQTSEGRIVFESRPFVDPDGGDCIYIMVD